MNFPRSQKQKMTELVFQSIMSECSFHALNNVSDYKCIYDKTVYNGGF